MKRVYGPVFESCTGDPIEDDLKIKKKVKIN